MTHRVISLDADPRVIPLDFPERSLPIIKERKIVTCLWDTQWRGELVFVSQRSTWAVATLTYIAEFLIPAKKDLPERKGYHWHLANFQCVVVPCGDYCRRDAIWHSPRGPEPPFLDAGAQAALNEMFPPAMEELEDPYEAAYRALKAAQS